MITPDQLAHLIARLAAQLGQDDDAAFAEAFGALVALVGEPAADAIWAGLVTRWVADQIGH